MLLALKDGKLIRANPGIYATCPFCEEDVMPRCGTIRMWHWAHKVGECIYHTESETDWHLEWKDRALKLGFEIEKRFDEHIADIYDPKTNTVIEVQHSPISEDEILDRTICYSLNNLNVKWIFDFREKFKNGNVSFIGVNENELHLEEFLQIADYNLDSSLFLKFLLPIYAKYTERYIKKSLCCLYDNGYDLYYDLCITMDNGPILSYIKANTDEDLKCFIHNKQRIDYKDFPIDSGKCIIYAFDDFKLNDDYLINYITQKHVFSFWSEMMQKVYIEHTNYIKQLSIKGTQEYIENFRNTINVFTLRCDNCHKATIVNATPLEMYNSILIRRRKHTCGGNVIVDNLSLYP